MEDSASSDASSDTTAEAASESSSRMSWAYDAKEDGLVGDLLNSMTSDLAPKSKTQTAPKRASSPPAQVSSKKAKQYINQVEANEDERTTFASSFSAVSAVSAAVPEAEHARNFAQAQG